MLAAQTPRIAYPGTGSSGTFQWQWLITDASQLYVAGLIPTGNTLDPFTEQALVLGTDYNIQTPATQVGSSAGGYIVLTVGGWAAPWSGNLPLGYVIVIRRVVTFDQPSEFTNQGAYSPASVESALDYLGMQIQQLQDQMGRVIQTPLDDYQAPGQGIGLAPDRASQFVCFDTAGNVTTAGAVTTLTPDDITAKGTAGIGLGNMGNTTACYLNSLISLTSADGNSYAWTSGVNVYAGMLVTCTLNHNSVSTTPTITTNFSFGISPNPIVNTIVNKAGGALSGGQLVTGTAYLLLYDGTYWRVMV